MSKELVISSNRHETKVAILEDDQLVEVFFQRANEYSLAGSIHKGRVTRVLPGMQSAFVDLGLERDAFLYVSDFSEEGEDFDRVAVSREAPRAERPARVPAEAPVLEEASDARRSPPYRRPTKARKQRRRFKRHRPNAARKQTGEDGGRAADGIAGAASPTPSMRPPRRTRLHALPSPPQPRRPNPFRSRPPVPHRQPTLPFFPANLSPSTPAPASSRSMKARRRRSAICRLANRQATQSPKRRPRSRMMRLWLRMSRRLPKKPLSLRPKSSSRPRSRSLRRRTCRRSHFPVPGRRGRRR